MTNNKFQKQMISIGTQFTQDDIFRQDEELIGRIDQQQVQNFWEKDSENILSKKQPSFQNSSSKQAKSGKKSINHNFQKHTVVTIKKLLRIKYDVNASEQQKLAHQIWKIFMATDLKSKKLLVILFGKANFNDQRNRKLFAQCGFQEILSQEQFLVKKAQQLLRQRFLETATKEVVRQNVQNFRNIKMKDQFLVYFFELLELIRKGAFVKLRINDKTAKKIESQIQIKKASTETLELF